jgi:hypothetical protein
VASCWNSSTFDQPAVDQFAGLGQHSGRCIDADHLPARADRLDQVAEVAPCPGTYLQNGVAGLEPERDYGPAAGRWEDEVQRLEPAVGAGDAVVAPGISALRAARRVLGCLGHRAKTMAPFLRQGSLGQASIREGLRNLVG